MSFHKATDFRRSLKGRVKAAKIVSSGLATSPVDVHTHLIPLLTSKAKHNLRGVSRTLTEGGVPEQSILGSSLIYKEKCAKYDVRSYTPITVTSVVYRLPMKIMKMTMKA